jgi:Fe-Mn family superoxide dismutase
MTKLPYPKDALAPHLSAETVEYHYGKHLQAYVNNLNNLIKGTEYITMSLEEIICSAEGGVFNNAAQVWNHTLYFTSFSPNPRTLPEGRLAEAIVRDFGSYEEFKAEFGKQAMALFGSGWTWLAADTQGHLSIVNKSNGGNPLTEGLTPLMVIDVWEHAYYIDYRNRRADSVEAFWKILDWKIVEERY